MTKKEQLYDAFGELAYVLTMSDGAIQPEEIEKIKSTLQEHPGGEAILWSFNYEARKGRSAEEVYQKVIDACREIGPDPEYPFLIDLLEKIATVHAGKNEAEDRVISGFVSDLIERFREDVGAIA